MFARFRNRDITWRGYKGFAFLHFVKSTSKENNQPLSVDNVLQMLQGLPLPHKEKKGLVIEQLKPKNGDGDKENHNKEETKSNGTMTNGESILSTTVACESALKAIKITE